MSVTVCDPFYSPTYETYKFLTMIVLFGMGPLKPLTIKSPAYRSQSKVSLKQYMDGLLSTCGKLRSLIRDVESSYSNNQTMTEQLLQSSQITIFWRKEKKKSIFLFSILNFKVRDAAQNPAWKARQKVRRGPRVPESGRSKQLQRDVPRLNWFSWCLIFWPFL